MRQQPFASPEEALAHYGKKGMRWGVTNEDKPVGRDSSGKVTSTNGRDSSGKVTPTGGRDGRDSSGKVTASAASIKAADYHRLADKIAEQAGVDPHLAAAKYGPPDMPGGLAKQQADRERLKKVAIGLGIGVGVAGIGIAAYKLNQSGVDVKGLDLDALKGDASKMAKLRELSKTSDKAYRNSADGLHINWDNGVDLPKGFVLRRLSSVAETTPRPEGFFAAHLDNDVDSYKAILPTFWARWGVGSAESGGFLNHYMAKEAVRAPSGKESFTLFKHLVETDDSFNEHFVSFWDKRGARGLSEERLKSLFVDSSGEWAMPTSAYTQRWFKEIQSRGYNAVIDFNDAGKLGKTPIRVIDGKMFDIVKNEAQSLDDFYAAAQKWAPELVHIFALPNGELVLIHFDEFLRTAKLGQDAISNGRVNLKKAIALGERR